MALQGWYVTHPDSGEAVEVVPVERHPDARAEVIAEVVAELRGLDGGMSGGYAAHYADFIEREFGEAK